MGKLLVLDLSTSSLSLPQTWPICFWIVPYLVSSLIFAPHTPLPETDMVPGPLPPHPPFFPACRPYRSGAPLVLAVGRAVRTYMSLERGAEPANTTQPGRASFPVASM